jgi:hypothetical protein
VGEASTTAASYPYFFIKKQIVTKKSGITKETKQKVEDKKIKIKTIKLFLKWPPHF